jgi:hypothetical protein
MKRSLSVKFAALAVVLFGSTVAQATPVPAETLQWTYNFSPGTPSLPSDANPSAYVGFTNEPTKAAVGSSDVVATNLRVFSSATAAAPDTLAIGGAYTLTLVLSTVDEGVPHSVSMTFNGELDGTFSAESANISNIFGPNAMQEVQLGSYIFKVSLIAYTPPGPPDQLNAGSIAARVEVSSGVVSENSPEPSTMLLSALGLSCLGGAAWRKRRQARVAAAA